MPARVTDYVRTAIDRTQGRSMVMSIGGIAASEHPLASQAGASILAGGGHAVDAAIAVNAVMGVVAPMMNGVGGDLFAIVYDASSGELHGINGSGGAPAGLTIDRLRASGSTSMPQHGIHSVTVPGAVAAWSMLSARFGRLPLGVSLHRPFRSLRKDFQSPKSRPLSGSGASRFCEVTKNRRECICPPAACLRSGRCSGTPIWQRRIARSHRRDVRRFTVERLPAGSRLQAE